VRVYRTTPQSVPNTTWTTISFDAERWDTDNIHDTVTNNDQLVCRTAGKYIIVGQVEWDPSTTGERIVGIYRNGSEISRVRGQPNSNGYINQVVSTEYDLGVGDYIQLKGYQSQGTAINVAAQPPWATEFMMALAGGMQGPQGLPGAGIPTPVVNGQWIKGSGGAAVWQPITYSDLPASLGQYNNGYSNYATDLNNCTQIGFYAFQPTTANIPFSGYGTVQTLTLFDNTNVRQIAYQYNSEASYSRRRNDGGAWTAWYRGIPGVVGYEPAAWPGNARMQTGVQSGTVGVAGHGGNAVTVNLPFAWPNSHLFFIAQSWPGSTWAGYSGIISCLAQNLSSGLVEFENTSSNNNYTLYWLSIGY
jgi:hypothetical protein